MASPKLKLADETTRKPTRRGGFTKAKLQAIKPPAKGETAIYDDKTPGLIYRVRATGSAGFFLYRKIKGRIVRMKLGEFPTMTIEQARTRAIALIADYNEGKDPAADLRDERGEMTVGRLWDTYAREHLHPRCRPSTIRNETALFRKHLSALKSRRLSSVKPANVKALHTKIGRTAPVSANRAVSMLGRLYRYAARHHGYTGPMPAGAVDKYPEEDRERFLSTDELSRFLIACDAEGQPWADFFRLCLATGARSGNIRRMRWDDINAEARTWTIQRTEAKGKRTMTIPLTDAAIAILDRRGIERGESPYVFPAIRDKGAGHLSQPARPLKRIIKAAKIDGVTIHDLRRTAGAYLAASGASLPIIGKALGHADLRSTQIYARLSLDPVREAMDKASKVTSGKGGKAKR